MTQSRRMSAVESVANVGVGFGIALLTQLAVFPMFGMATTAVNNLAIAAIFTVVSLIRSYVVRRAFNAIRGVR